MLPATMSAALSVVLSVRVPPLGLVTMVVTTSPATAPEGSDDNTGVPPALAASPAAELAKYVGQAVVVARCDKTGQGALEDAIKLLSGCPNIQLLLNAVHFSPSGRRFGSYYGYGG